MTKTHLTRLCLLLALAALGAALPTGAMAAIAERTGAVAHLLDEALIAVSLIGLLWLLDTLSWSAMTTRR